MGIFKSVANVAAVTRPADTTQYAAGDLVANSTTAGSVTPIQFSVGGQFASGGKIVGGKMRKSTNGVTTASFRLHLFTATKTVTNGDNGAIVVNSMDGYLGYLNFDFATIADDTNIIGGAIEKTAAALAAGLPFKAPGGVLYGLIEAKGAYTPASAEVFNSWLFIEK